MRKVLVILFAFNVFGCEQAKISEPPEYRGGKYQKVLSSGPEYNVFKGMIYEYGIGINKDINKASYFYRSSKPERVGLRRLFLMCFIDCPEQLQEIYQELGNSYAEITNLYALDLTLREQNCESKVTERICSKAREIVGEYYEIEGYGNEFYYEAGLGVYNKALENDVGNFQRLEIPYYFLKRAAVDGNTEADSFLNSLPPHKSWVPHDNWIN